MEYALQKWLMVMAIQWSAFHWIDEQSAKSTQFSIAEAADNMEVDLNMKIKDKYLLDIFRNFPNSVGSSASILKFLVFLEI